VYGRTPLCRTPLSTCRTPLRRKPSSVSVSNLSILLYLSVACCGSSVHHKTVILYTFIYNIPQRIYTQFLAHVFSLPSLVPILFIFFRCIRTRGPLANRRAGLLRLAVSPASLRGWRRRTLTPSPYISHYIYPTVTSRSSTKTAKHTTRYGRFMCAQKLTKWPA